MNKAEIVRRAILEAGVDEEVPISIDNPEDLTPRQRRFVSWADEAWADIQRERDDWEWRRGYATTTVYPRVKFDARLLSGMRA